jgi:hypothetical protein
MLALSNIPDEPLSRGRTQTLWQQVELQRKCIGSLCVLAHSPCVGNKLLPKRRLYLLKGSAYRAASSFFLRITAVR